MVVDVSFSMEPSRAPTVQFAFSTKGSAIGSAASGTTLTMLADETVCSYPTQSMTIEGRWCYAYTLPAPTTLQGNIIPPHRLVFARRCRFGGLEGSGRKLEGGGYALVTDKGVYLGRTGIFEIGGQSFAFMGGVLLEPTTAEVPMVADDPGEDCPTRIRGKRLSFPVHFKKGVNQ